jgi:hypothetical protein
MSPEQFETYRHEAVHFLMDLNEKCEKIYGTNRYPRWDYDLEAGTLVFSDQGIPKTIASVQVVGTTSVQLKNWLWSWANENIPSSVTELVKLVREFGEREGLTQLTESHCPDDEFLGWELTAVAARILGAKGAYRCPDDDGFTYFVYIDIRSATEAEQSEATRSQKTRVECDDHGSGFPTYVCQHLVEDPRQEWFSSEPDESNPWPDAWCASCDEFFQEQGGWNEQNEGRMKIKLLCQRCYESARAKGTFSQ